MAAGVGEEDADLGVLDPARGAGVLPGDARRPDALLEGPGLVEDQDAVRVAEPIGSATCQAFFRCTGPRSPAR